MGSVARARASVSWLSESPTRKGGTTNEKWVAPSWGLYRYGPLYMAVWYMAKTVGEGQRWASLLLDLGWARPAQREEVSRYEIDPMFLLPSKIACRHGYFPSCRGRGLG